MPDSSIAITPGSGAALRVLTGLGAGSAGQQVFTVADANGILNGSDPDGTFQIANDPTTLLLDSFDTGTLGNWTTGGTAPSVSAGNVTFSNSTTASVIGYMRSNGFFTLATGAYLRINHLVRLETTAAITNNTRWWGYGTNASSPTAAAPVLHGAVFLLDYAAGAFQAATYNNGTKTVVATLTKPTDGLTHRYELWYRQSVTYWTIDNVVVATASMPNYAVVSGQFSILGSANFTSAASAAPTFVLSSAGVSDTSRANQQISDGVLPWVKASVRQTMELATAIAPANDNALVVHNYPTASLHATNLSAAATAGTLTLAAPGTGLRHYITGIWIQRIVGATAVTAAASAFVTTSSNTTIVYNLPSDAASIGSVQMLLAVPYSSPIPSLAQNTATTFTTPAGSTTVQFRISVTYFIAA